MLRTPGGANLNNQQKYKIMYIQNNNDYTLTPAQQQAVINAATNYGGIDEVVMGELFEDEYADGLMYAPVEDINGEFLFNLNLNTGETF